MFLPIIEHKIKKGENLTSIVKKHGFPGNARKAIYNAKYNAKLRTECPNPNLILPGKVFKLPSTPKAQLLKGKTYLDKAKAHYQAEIALQDFNLAKYAKLAEYAEQEDANKQSLYLKELKALKKTKPGDDLFARCKEEYANPIFLAFFGRCKNDVVRHKKLIEETERLTKMALRANLQKKKETIARLRALKDRATEARAHANQILTWLLEIEKKVNAAIKETV
ncbi:hypothetical protein AB2B41_08250 [Marimonas sp. MJW-29]|uniref:LysM domain-containing protein n=1 Tax=Sulfitobacter sediminis TaxID=3234186 RepID=A0ABV3RKT8_9RHOB